LILFINPEKIKTLVRDKKTDYKKLSKQKENNKNTVRNFNKLIKIASES